MLSGSQVLSRPGMRLHYSGPVSKGPQKPWEMRPQMNQHQRRPRWQAPDRRAIPTTQSLQEGGLLTNAYLLTMV